MNISLHNRSTDTSRETVQQQNEENNSSAHKHTMADCIEKVGGDKKLFLKILSVFVEKHSNDDIRVIKMLEEGNSVDARKLIHSLKGVSLVVGAKDLHSTTIELEKILLKESDFEITPLLQQFETNLQKTISCLQRYITRSGDSN